MTVSIIIAVKEWQKNLEECVGKCQELDYPDFEILVLPDSPLQGLFQQTVTGQPPSGLSYSVQQETVPFSKGTVSVQVIPTGAVSPAKKRDLAMNNARGEMLAFIDDDAYPQKSWLKNAMKNFLDPQVAAVGGPAITPLVDTLRQKGSGLVYASILVSGKYAYRYLPKKKQGVDDYPSCNFLVRKSVMQELGGFNTNYWPGEDTKLCLDITKKLGKKIIYDPEVLVYHHRRPLFLPHIRQVESYALHRGYFVKKYPATSLKISYFLPSLFVLGIFLAGIFSLFSAPLRMLYFSGLCLYLLLVLFFSFSKELNLSGYVFLGTILTHLTYGIYFIKGLVLRRLKEE